jgi:DNA invertase Pin-like site-specific DNA recombinase
MHFLAPPMRVMSIPEFDYATKGHCDKRFPLLDCLQELVQHKSQLTKTDFKRAEGTGFVPAAFRNYCNYSTFQFNLQRRFELAHSTYSQSFPVVPCCGRAPPGQNRDNFANATDFVELPLTRAQIPFQRFHPSETSRWWILFISSLGMVVGAGKSAPDDDERRLPRPPRQNRRPKEVIGLPSDEELRKLATEYLTIQRKNFPELARQRLLPTPTEEIIAAMVQDFKQRHGGTPIDPERLSAYRRLKMAFGGSYARYSCDNSKPSSILDQTRNNLNKAASEKCFLPWEYVFADYSVSGLKSSRTGYKSYKAVLGDAKHFIGATFIDDYSRASRSELEWWRLAHLCKKLKKRLIGSSDGFDLDSPLGEIMVRIFNILSLLFLKQLREKVGRGMRRRAEEGTTMGRPGLGFTRRVRLDASGKQILNPDGSPVTELCIDPDTAEIVRRIVHLYIDKLLSFRRIAQILNEENADGFNRWTEMTIRKILETTSIIGVFVWNRTRKEFDLDEEDYVVVQRPRSEWVYYYDQSLALISIDEWFRIRERLAQIKRRPIGERPVSQNEKYPTTPLSGTLKCGYCDRDLTLLRSTLKYKVFYCPNGDHRANNCKLRTSKSSRILEQGILEFLGDSILTEEAIATLLKSANEHLAREAAKPPANTQKLTSEIRRLHEKTDRLIKQVADEPDKAIRDAYHKQVQVVRAELDRKLAQKQKLQPLAKSDLQPLDEGTLRSYVADLRQVVNQDIPVAAAAIRALTGPIKIYQGPKSQRRSKGATWKAVFTPNLPNALVHLAKKNSYPEALLLEYLYARIWISSKSIEEICASQLTNDWSAMG